MKRKSDRTGEHPNLFDNCCFPEKKMASIRIIDKKNDRDWNKYASYIDFNGKHNQIFFPININ